MDVRGIVFGLKEGLDMFLFSKAPKPRLGLFQPEVDLEKRVPMT
jgi:hypothetical protein